MMNKRSKFEFFLFFMFLALIGSACVVSVYSFVDYLSSDLEVFIPDWAIGVDYSRDYQLGIAQHYSDLVCHDIIFVNVVMFSLFAGLITAWILNWKMEHGGI